MSAHYGKTSKPVNYSGSLISASRTCLLKFSEVREPCSANNHRKSSKNSSKNSSKSYSIHGGRGWVQTMQKIQTIGIFRGNSQDSPHNGRGSIEMTPHHKAAYLIKHLFLAWSSADPPYYATFSNFSLIGAREKTSQWRIMKIKIPSINSCYFSLDAKSKHFNRKKALQTWFTCKSQHLNLKSLRNLHNHLWPWARLLSMLCT